jgi:tripartite-type tricarboxylate transporter receptor subunit TctC
LSYAGTGTGGATHLATELFSSMAKIKMVAIQYKSTGAAMADLLSGQVPVIWAASCQSHRISLPASSGPSR